MPNVRVREENAVRCAFFLMAGNVLHSPPLFRKSRRRFQHIQFSVFGVHDAEASGGLGLLFAVKNQLAAMAAAARVRVAAILGDAKHNQENFVRRRCCHAVFTTRTSAQQRQQDSTNFERFHSSKGSALALSFLNMKKGNRRVLYPDENDLQGFHD